MKLSSTIRILVSLSLITMLFTTACVNTRSATYFNGVNDATLASATSIPESIIQKNDLISVSISSLSAEASAVIG